jgi:hypothetical protein
MNLNTFRSIERIMAENGIPIPEGRGEEKLDAISRIVEDHPMSEDVRERLRNLLGLR